MKFAVKHDKINLYNIRKRWEQMPMHWVGSKYENFYIY